MSCECECECDACIHTEAPCGNVPYRPCRFCAFITIEKTAVSAQRLAKLATQWIKQGNKSMVSTLTFVTEPCVYATEMALNLILLNPTKENMTWALSIDDEVKNILQMSSAKNPRQSCGDNGCFCEMYTLNELLSSKMGPQMVALDKQIALTQEAVHKGRESTAVTQRALDDAIFKRDVACEVLVQTKGTYGSTVALRIASDAVASAEKTHTDAMAAVEDGPLAELKRLMEHKKAMM